MTDTSSDYSIIGQYKSYSIYGEEYRWNLMIYGDSYNLCIVLLEGDYMYKHTINTCGVLLYVI